MSKSLSDLAMQLREIHAILVGCGAKVVIDEAADKLEELQAELIARDKHDDVFVARINELLAERNAALAQLAAREKQEPEPEIAAKWSWYDDNSGSFQTDVIRPPYGGMQEGQEVTFYASAGASAGASTVEPSQIGSHNEELSDPASGAMVIVTTPEGKESDPESKQLHQNFADALTELFGVQVPVIYKTAKPDEMPTNKEPT